VATPHRAAGRIGRPSAAIETIRQQQSPNVSWTAGHLQKLQQGT
jgi:hypothetical protein